MLSYFRHAQRQWGYHQETFWLTTTGTIATLALVVCSMMRKHQGAARGLCALGYEAQTTTTPLMTELQDGGQSSNSQVSAVSGA